MSTYQLKSLNYRFTSGLDARSPIIVLEESVSNQETLACNTSVLSRLFSDARLKKFWKRLMPSEIRFQLEQPSPVSFNYFANILNDLKTKKFRLKTINVALKVYFVRP